MLIQPRTTRHSFTFPVSQVAYCIFDSWWTWDAVALTHMGAKGGRTLGATHIHSAPAKPESPAPTDWGESPWLQCYGRKPLQLLQRLEPVLMATKNMSWIKQKLPPHKSSKWCPKELKLGVQTRIVCLTQKKHAYCSLSCISNSYHH